MTMLLILSDVAMDAGSSAADTSTDLVADAGNVTAADADDATASQFCHCY